MVGLERAQEGFRHPTLSELPNPNGAGRHFAPALENRSFGRYDNLGLVTEQLKQLGPEMFYA